MARECAGLQISIHCSLICNVIVIGSVLTEFDLLSELASEVLSVKPKLRVL